jgi:hypothetical protein
MAEYTILPFVEIEVRLGTQNKNHFDSCVDKRYFEKINEMLHSGEWKSVIYTDSTEYIKDSIKLILPDNKVILKENVLTKIKTVDGTGSGLDADLLNGFTSNYTNVPYTIVSRDSGGSFAAQTITAVTFSGPLTGNVTGNLTGNTAGIHTGSVVGNLTGDVTGVSAAWTGSGDISFATTIAANSVALGTDTTGDYVSTLTAGTGVSVGTATGEGSTPTISIGQAIGTGNSPTFAGITIPSITTPRRRLRRKGVPRQHSRQRSKVVSNGGSRMRHRIAPPRYNLRRSWTSRRWRHTSSSRPRRSRTCSTNKIHFISCTLNNSSIRAGHPSKT